MESPAEAFGSRWNHSLEKGQFVWVFVYLINLSSKIIKKKKKIENLWKLRHNNRIYEALLKLAEGNLRMLPHLIIMIISVMEFKKITMILGATRWYLYECWVTKSWQIGVLILLLTIHSKCLLNLSISKNKNNNSC